MSKNQTLLALQNIFREVFDDDQLIVTQETGPKDVDGWDSVAQVKLIIMIEERFGIQLSEDEIISVGSVGEFLEAIEKNSNR